MENLKNSPIKSGINWFKIVGIAFLLHVVLVAISIIEVFIYSLLINPGQANEVYQAHAEVSGPWISGIFGSVFIFLLVRRFIKKNAKHHMTYAIALPLIYILLDVIILLFFSIDWNEHLPVLFAANGVKIIAALISYYVFKPKN